MMEYKDEVPRLGELTRLSIIGEETLKAWEKLLEPWPYLEFLEVEPESKIHYRLRRIKERLGIAVRELRFRLSVLIYGHEEEDYY